MLRGKSAIRLTNNCFLSHIRRCDIANTGHGRYGIMADQTAYSLQIEDVQIAGFDMGIASLAQLSLRGANYLINNTMQFTAMHAYTVEIGGTNMFLDEGSVGQGIPIDYSIALIGCNAAHVTGLAAGRLEAPAPAVVIDGVNMVNGERTHVFTACKFVCLPGSSGVFRILSPGGSVVADHCGTQDRTTTNWLTDDTHPEAQFVLRPASETGTADITLPDQDATVSRNQWLYAVLIFTGDLTADRTVTVPALPAA